MADGRPQLVIDGQEQRPLLRSEGVGLAGRHAENPLQLPFGEEGDVGDQADAFLPQLGRDASGSWRNLLDIQVPSLRP